MVLRNTALLFAFVFALLAAQASVYNCIRSLTGSPFWRAHQPGDDRVEWVTDSAQLPDVKKEARPALRFGLNPTRPRLAH